MRLRRRPESNIPSCCSLPVPARFVGVDVDGPMLDPPSTLNVVSQFKDMVGSGVQSVRVAFNWAFAQPYQNWSDVPASQQSQFTDVNGTPVNFSRPGVPSAPRVGFVSGCRKLPTAT